MTFRKVLWVEDLPDIPHLLTQAQTAGAAAVAVRTTADNFHESIPTFHAAGLQIYGWRFPPVVRDAAIAQAQHVVALMALGLDGFIVDPEGSDTPGDNWDQPGLGALAHDYCAVIRAAHPDRVFGLTSHYAAAQTYPRLPWAEFLHHSDKVYPQSYWRMQTPYGPRPVGAGQPQPNFQNALTAWQAVGAPADSILPMAGEMAVAQPAEIAAYASAARAHGLTEMHFYIAGAAAPEPILDAIRQL